MSFQRKVRISVYKLLVFLRPVKQTVIFNYCVKGITSMPNLNKSPFRHKTKSSSSKQQYRSHGKSKRLSASPANGLKSHSLKIFTLSSSTFLPESYKVTMDYRLSAGQLCTAKVSSQIFYSIFYL